MSDLAADYDVSLPRSRRRVSGAYYTPPFLIDILLDGGLEPLLDRTPDPSRIRIADPACGNGRFLVAAAERIARRGVRLKHVVRRCLFGVDTDPIAVRRCRQALAELAGCQVGDITQIRRRDGLTAWTEQEFDAVIGNPPFRNAIEGERRSYPAHPLIGGTADLAYRFLVRATELVRPGGTVAMVQPRPMLNSPCLERFRQRGPNGLRPNMIFAPDRSRLFPGALVFTCGLVLGPDETCRVSRDPESGPESWREGIISSTNWWSGVNALLDESGCVSTGCSCGPQLGDFFEVWAGMTAGEAYDLRPFIRESPRA